MGRCRRGALWAAHVAGVGGQREHHRIHRIPARHLQIHPRPGIAPGQQGIHAPPRGRRGRRTARGTGSQLGQPRLSRHAAPRCACGVHEGTGHVGRRSGLAAPTSTGRIGPAVRRIRRCGQHSRRGTPAFDTGDYRWATQILHPLVFADPDNTAARELQADAYEQMGYQAEGPQWRGGSSSVLQRNCAKDPQPMPFVTASRDSILAMPIDILFDFVAVQIDGPKAADADIRIDFEFTDEGVRWTMWIRRGVLNARRGSSPAAAADRVGPEGRARRGPRATRLRAETAGVRCDHPGRRRAGSVRFRGAARRVRPPQLPDRHPPVDRTPGAGCVRAARTAQRRRWRPPREVASSLR